MFKTVVWAGLGIVAVVVAGCATSADDVEVGASEAALNQDCSLVRCALPLCAQGQHLSYQGGCCPTCVGPEPKCAAVLCAAVACADGEQAVTPKGQCCPRCAKAPATATCTTDADCPSIACIMCPCPVSTCKGRQCTTTTPDASTCASP